MRLLVCTQDFPPSPGGIQTYTWELAQRLAPRCEELVVVAPDQPTAAEHDRRAPFEVVRLPVSGNLIGMAALPVLRRPFDVVFCTQWNTALAPLAARRAGHPARIVVAAHGRELLLRPWRAVPVAQRAYDAIRRHVIHAADALTPVSAYTGSLLQQHGVPASRITVVTNGVTPERYRGGEGARLRERLELRGPLLLTVARMVPRKGIDTVLEALPALAQRHPDLTYVVIGDGRDRPRLEALARPVRELVRFIGEVDDDTLRAFYDACDIYVMPARSEPPDVEGFGLVFLEAGACGKPVVGARAGGVVDAIEDDVTGLLVPPGDAPALGEALGRLLADPSLRRRLGSAGAAHAETHTWDRAADRIGVVLRG